MNKLHPESSALERMNQMKPDWPADFEVKSAILQGLAPFEQRRYLKQLGLEGYTPGQINELSASISTVK